MSFISEFLNEFRLNESVPKFSASVLFPVRHSKTKSVQFEGPYSHTSAGSSLDQESARVSSCEQAVAYALLAASLPPLLLLLRLTAACWP